ncbi:MAG: TadE/TadG family type IV pilus assembly protein [Anaerolineales bacterium]
MKPINLVTPKTTERGQSLVELALGFTFILILLAGAINFGEAFFIWIALREATQEGAVYAARHPAAINDTEIRNRVRAAVQTEIPSFNINRLDTNIERSTSPICPGNAITVSARYRFSILVPFVSTAVAIVLPTENGTPYIDVRASTTNTVLISDDTGCP